MFKSPVYLGIDSASPYLALALWSQGGVLASFCEEVGRDHAKRIGTELETLFARAEVSRADLGGVCVGVGPGSYTGLKVAVAVAKGITQALGITLRGESSLAAMAAAALTKSVPKGVIALDARRGNVYAGVFERTQAGLLYGDIEKVSRTDLQARYPDLPYFENSVPDAAYLARRAAEGPKDAAPLYF